MISTVKTTVGGTSNKRPIMAIKLLLSAHPEDRVSIFDASPRILIIYILATLSSMALYKLL